jgi:hypothetical protein
VGVAGSEHFECHEERIGRYSASPSTSLTRPHHPYPSPQGGGEPAQPSPGVALDEAVRESLSAYVPSLFLTWRPSLAMAVSVCCLRDAPEALVVAAHAVPAAAGFATLPPHGSRAEDQRARHRIGPVPCSSSQPRPHWAGLLGKSPGAARRAPQAVWRWGWDRPVRRPKAERGAGVSRGAARDGCGLLPGAELPPEFFALRQGREARAVPRFPQLLLNKARTKPAMLCAARREAGPACPK